MIQKLKLIIKAGIFSMLFAGLVIFNMLLFHYIFESVDWMIFSIFVSLGEIVIFINYVFPIVFKDFIEEYERKEEIKNA